MERQERLKIAEEVAEDILKKYDGIVLAIGVCGSVARGEDTTYSDLDMLAIVRRKGKEIYDRFFIYKGLPVLVEFWTPEEAKKCIRNMWFKWPIEVGTFLHVLPLFDPEGVFEGLKKERESLKEEDFKEGATNALEHVYESFLSVKNAFINKRKEIVLLQARVLAQNVASFLALVNHTHFESGKRVFDKEFKERPKDYDELIKVVAGLVSLDHEEVYQASEKLFEVIVSFAKRKGISIDDSRIRV